MKKIGIDARLYFKTGIGVYIRNLLYYLQKNPPQNMVFYVYVMQEDSKIIQFSHPQVIKQVVNYPWHSLSEQIGFAGRLYKDNLDLMHFTYFSYPLLYRKKFLATVHDLTPLLFRTGRASTKNQLVYAFKHLVLRALLARQVSSSLALITPTKTIKKQLIRVYGEQYASKIVPIYEGVNYELLKAEEDRRLKKQFRTDFFLYVGNFYPHKNTEGLIRAFAQVKTDKELILVGPRDFFSQAMARIVHKLNQEHRVRFFYNNSCEELVFFYKHATALIHPSFSEGFGLPIIEAAYFGLPIIASHIDVFKELLGENYSVFNPYDVADIAEKIQAFVEKKDFPQYQELLNMCSFENMVKETIHLYETY